MSETCSPDQIVDFLGLPSSAILSNIVILSPLCPRLLRDAKPAPIMLRRLERKHIRRYLSCGQQLWAWVTFDIIKPPTDLSVPIHQRTFTFLHDCTVLVIIWYWKKFVEKLHLVAIHLATEEIDPQVGCAFFNFFNSVSDFTVHRASQKMYTLVPIA